MAAPPRQPGWDLCRSFLAVPRLGELAGDAFALRADSDLARLAMLRDSRRCSVVFSALADGLQAYMKR